MSFYTSVEGQRATGENLWLESWTRARVELTVPFLPPLFSLFLATGHHHHRFRHCLYFPLHQPTLLPFFAKDSRARL